MVMSFHAPISADIVELASCLRRVDLAEVVALGRAPATALADGIRTAREAWTVRDAEGRIICMAGVSPYSLIGNTGVPWLLGTELVNRHKRTFMVETRRVVTRWLTMFDVLRNVVDARYVAALRWLDWLGFEFGPPFVLAHGVFRRVWKESP